MKCSPMSYACSRKLQGGISRKRSFPSGSQPFIEELLLLGITATCSVHSFMAQTLLLWVTKVNFGCLIGYFLLPFSYTAAIR